MRKAMDAVVHRIFPDAEQAAAHGMKGRLQWNRKAELPLDALQRLLLDAKRSIRP